MKKQTISITWNSYNDRRMSKPWIARVDTWTPGTSPDLVWGCYTGDYTGGVTEIMARVGQLIRYGQKDYRKPAQSLSKWAIVEENGTLRDISAVDARALHTAYITALQAEQAEQAEQAKQAEQAEQAKQAEQTEQLTLWQ